MIYDDMKTRNYDSIINHHMMIDAQLNTRFDPRRCLCILERYNEKNFTATDKYYCLLNDLSNLFGQQTYYHYVNTDEKNGTLHHTL